MEIITLKDAARITKLSYTYMFENKSKYGFARQGGKGRWLVDKKLFEMFPVYTGINRKLHYNTYLSEDVPCIYRDKPSLLNSQHSMS